MSLSKTSTPVDAPHMVPPTERYSGDWAAGSIRFRLMRPTSSAAICQFESGSENQPFRRAQRWHLFPTSQPPDSFEMRSAQLPYDRTISIGRFPRDLVAILVRDTWLAVDKRDVLNTPADVDEAKAFASTVACDIVIDRRRCSPPIPPRPQNDQLRRSEPLEPPIERRPQNDKRRPRDTTPRRLSPVSVSESAVDSASTAIECATDSASVVSIPPTARAPRTVSFIVSPIVLNLAIVNDTNDDTIHDTINDTIHDMNENATELRFNGCAPASTCALARTHPLARMPGHEPLSAITRNIHQSDNIRPPVNNVLLARCDMPATVAIVLARSNVFALDTNVLASVSAMNVSASATRVLACAPNVSTRSEYIVDCAVNVLVLVKDDLTSALDILARTLSARAHFMYDIYFARPYAYKTLAHSLLLGSPGENPFVFVFDSDLEPFEPFEPCASQARLSQDLTCQPFEPPRGFQSSEMFQPNHSSYSLTYAHPTHLTSHQFSIHTL